MPSPGESYKYVQIKDFKPGIADNPGSNYPPGTAQRNLTFRCIANRAGALIPLPFGLGQPVPPKEASTAAIVGIYLPPLPILPAGGATIDAYPTHELWVGVEILNASQRYHRLYRFRMSESGNPFDIFKSFATSDLAPSNLPNPGGFTPNGMWFGTVRSNRATPTNPGVPVVIAGWGSSVNNMYVSELPDDQNAGTNTPYNIYVNNILLNGVTCHEGRVVVTKMGAYGHGPNATALVGEQVAWTAINDVTVANISSPDQVFVPENPSGFAFLFSMSANELFGVKIATGGVYVTGDLNQAVVVTLPLVTGSDVNHTPAASELGVIYGSRLSGVWAWSHGDNCNLISPQMDPLFWTLENPPTSYLASGKDDFGSNLYSFGRSDDWVLTPNNWLFDTQLKSWWRLEDPSLRQYRWMTANFRFIYAATSWFQGIDNKPDAPQAPIFLYDRQVPANSYSWQSQPLWETIDTLVDMREIVVRARGHGTIHVELYGESTGASPASVALTVSSDVPVLMRAPIRTQDSNIAVRIISDSDFTGTPPFAAPTVYECSLGYIESQKETTT